MIRIGLHPYARAASTNSRCATTSVAARDRRMNVGTDRIASPRIRLVRLEPRIATIAMMNTSPGNARTTSVTSASPRSVRPPK
jgi:hypothetical protein